MPTAILVDGAYFLKRYAFVRGEQKDAKQTAKDLFTWSIAHLEDKDYGRRDLYRIFFYDCAPFEKKIHNPISGKVVDFSKTATSVFRKEFHDELRKQRKVALRLGRLSDKSGWSIKDERMKDLLAKRIRVEDLTEKDITFNVRQKGIDMRIGLDIATMAFKKQVDQLILLSGDPDFVPAAKLARREGIDFILDPMWKEIPEDLLEHIDGLKSTCPRPKAMRRPGEESGPGAGEDARQHSAAHAGGAGGHGQEGRPIYSAEGRAGADSRTGHEGREAFAARAGARSGQTQGGFRAPISRPKPFGASGPRIRSVHSETESDFDN